MMVILAGAVWLMMLIFGCGPYNTGEEKLTPTASETVVCFNEQHCDTNSKPGFNQYGWICTDSHRYNHPNTRSFSLPDIR